MHSPADGPIPTTLAINTPGDEYEREADRVAGQVMRMPEQAQRTCACGGTCPRCQGRQPASVPERLHGSHLHASAPGQAAAPPIVHAVLRSPGRPLDAATRAFMEPRLGHDFGPVRVHADVMAATSAAAIGAAAYAVGPDLVFGAGRYAPGSQDGKRLLAHELAHVVQQGSGVRRMTLGAGTAPVSPIPDSPLREVFPEERGRVQAAVERIRKIARDPKAYSACHQAFAETCPGGNASSLASAFDRTVLWRFPHGKRLGVGATTMCGEDPPAVAYSDTGYSGGEVSLAYDLLHELGHVCGIACPDLPHYLADKLALNCMGPVEADERHELTLRVGRSTENWAVIASYGWLLHEWQAGRLSLRMDLDFNVAAATLAGDRTRAGGEIGGSTLGLRLRPFSSEHFGGLSFHAGAGAELGRFRVRPPAAGDPPTIRTAAALVLEVGGRIEWWVKDSAAVDAEGEEGRVRPRGLDFSYRMIQPATAGAQRVHELLAGYIFHF
jgi:hypothetical protein